MHHSHQVYLFLRVDRRIPFTGFCYLSRTSLRFQHPACVAGLRPGHGRVADPPCISA